MDDNVHVNHQSSYIHTIYKLHIQWPMVDIKKKGV